MSESDPGELAESEETMNSIIKQGIIWTLALGLAGCASFNTFSTDSRLPDQLITIDGKADDWAGNLFVVPNERMELGFLNDRDFLYLCLLTTDNYDRAGIMTQGLIVWFDPQGGDKKTFGIKFPLGLPPGERKIPVQANPRDPEFDNLPDVPRSEMEVIRSETEPPQKLKLADVKDVEIKVAPSAGLLVYELKIPLVRSGERLVAVGTEPGKTIGIGFETAKLELSPQRRKGTGTIPGGAGRPPVSGSSGMGGYDRSPQLPEGMKVWAIVKLAEARNGQRAVVFSFSY